MSCTIGPTRTNILPLVNKFRQKSNVLNQKRSGFPSPSDDTVYRAFVRVSSEFEHNQAAIGASWRLFSIFHFYKVNSVSNYYVKFTIGRGGGDYKCKVLARASRGPGSYLPAFCSRNAQFQISSVDVSLAVVEARHLQHLPPYGRVRTITSDQQVASVFFRFAIGTTQMIIIEKR